MRHVAPEGELLGASVDKNQIPNMPAMASDVQRPQLTTTPCLLRLPQSAHSRASRSSRRHRQPQSEVTRIFRVRPHNGWSRRAIYFRKVSQPFAERCRSSAVLLVALSTPKNGGRPCVQHEIIARAKEIGKHCFRERRGSDVVTRGTSGQCGVGGETIIFGGLASVGRCPMWSCVPGPGWGGVLIGVSTWRHAASLDYRVPQLAESSIHDGGCRLLLAYRPACRKIR